MATANVLPKGASQIVAHPGSTLMISVVEAPPPPAPPPIPVAFGGYTPTAGTASNYTTRYGARPGIVHQFVPIVDTTTAPSNEKTNRAIFDAAFAADALANGAVPLFTHELRDHRIKVGIPQPQYTLDMWISGANDAPLVAWLKAAGAWGHRFLYRIGWEMTAGDYTWSINFPGAGNTCGKYIDFWRHVITLQRQYAPLGESIWCPSVLLPPNAQLTPMAWCYPGTDWVRWCGLDGYITGNVSASGPNRDFYDLFEPSVAELARFAPDKNVTICETGVNPAIPGTYSADWLAAIPVALRQLPSVRGVVLFDSNNSIVRNPPQLGVVSAIAQDPLLAGPLI